MYVGLYFCIYNIVVPLAVQSPPDNVTSLEGGNIDFTCTISGTDIINVTWISPFGASLEQSSQYSITADVSSTSVTSTLRITNVQWPDDHGFYSCRAYADNFTEITSVETSVHLHVQGVCTRM